jgi:NTP pyrophosphatase (non-canonical NTP hydrolase)
VDQILQKLLEFRNERGWKKFHTPRNLAMSVSIESAEILEKFQWKLDEKLTKEERQGLEEEIADVFIYTLQLADSLGIDLEKATLKKIAKNGKKYPVKKAKGNATKYTKFL